MQLSNGSLAGATGGLAHVDTTGYCLTDLANSGRLRFANEVLVLKDGAPSM